MPIPPNALAERSIIASALSSPTCAEIVLDRMSLRDFTDQASIAAYRAMQSLQRRGESIDVVTVAVEASEALYAVMEDHAIYSDSGIHAVCDTVLELSRQKQLVSLYESERQAIERDGARSHESGESVTGKIHAILDGSTQHEYRPSEAADSFCADLDKEVRGVPWCIQGLHELCGPMGGGELIVLGGRPGTGKTAFALSQAIYLARNGCPVGIFSMEMAARELVARQFAHETGVPMIRLKTRRWADGEKDLVLSVKETIGSWPLIIDDTARLTPTRLRRRLRAMIARSNVQAAFVDYIQLMSGEGNTQNRATEIGQVTRELKITAKEFDIPIVALSQLSRKNESRADPRPLLSDLRESGSIEQDADGVIFTHREIRHVCGQEVLENMLLVGKSRNGPIGLVEASMDQVRMKWS